MGSVCKGQNEDFIGTIDNLDNAQIYSILGLVCITAVIVVTFTAYIFCQRSSE